VWAVRGGAGAAAVLRDQGPPPAHIVLRNPAVHGQHLRGVDANAGQHLPGGHQGGDGRGRLADRVRGLPCLRHDAAADLGGGGLWHRPALIFPSIGCVLYAQRQRRRRRHPFPIFHFPFSKADPPHTCSVSAISR